MYFVVEFGEPLRSGKISISRNVRIIRVLIIRQNTLGISRHFHFWNCELRAGNIFCQLYSSFFRQIKAVTIQTNFQSKRRTICWRKAKLHKMGCCLSKTDENQDKMFDPNEGEVICKVAGPCLTLDPENLDSDSEEIPEIGSNQSRLEKLEKSLAGTESGEYEEPRKARQWVERIETNKDTLVLSVLTLMMRKLSKIEKNQETLMEEIYGGDFF